MNAVDWKFLNAFPTAVGMNRYFKMGKELYESVPHSRGDEPMKVGGDYDEVKRSPQPWG